MKYAPKEEIQMIALREMTRMINKKVNQLKRIVVVDYRDGGVVFWGTVRDFAVLVISLWPYDPEEVIAKIKKNFGFSLKNDLWHYRVRSFYPVTEQYELEEIMANQDCLDDIGMSCDYKNPV